MDYFIPGRFSLFGKRSIVNLKTDKGKYDLQVINTESVESCQINFKLQSTFRLNLVHMICLNKCVIKHKTTKLKVDNYTIHGDQVEFNSQYISAKYLDFKAINGRFQLNYADIKHEAKLNIESGDIIYQTPKEILIDFIHSVPSFCIGSPAIVNPVITGCQLRKGCIVA